MKNWPADAPQLPEAATKHTKAGAEAFVKYFVDVANYASMTPASGLIPQLSETTCELCAILDKDAARLKKDHQRYFSPLIEVSGVKTWLVENDGRHQIRAKVRQHSVEYGDIRTSKVSGTSKPSSGYFAFAADFNQGRWRLIAMQEVKS